ncbi:MAG TPA: DinB family protein [Candidatus Eisenbacteria bacterium]
MPKIEKLFLKLPPRCRSKEVALQLGAMNDMTRRLFEEDLEKVTKDELCWQPAPGRNTIGMLLAHLAIVETFWTQVGVERLDTYDIKHILGIGMDDDGIPVPPGGGAYPDLKGKSLSHFEKLLEKSRKYVTRKWSPLSDRDMKKPVNRTRRDGSHAVTDPRWILYHMVEHFAGHQGQILLIRHEYRDFRAGR